MTVGQITEKFVDGTGGRFHFVKEQDCTKILQAIKELPDHVVQSKLRKSNQRLLGSVPNLIAVSWATEWGVAPYGKAWLEKATSRLKNDPNWSALRVRY